MRTYAGHSTAAKSNELYRRNLAKGQTGLSIAFDLPTQTGYDPDHELSRGEVGKVGVSIAHKRDMHALLDGIPLDEMNTSMTINATAAWLLALYMTVAEENGVERGALQGTTQNDIIKEFLSRGTYAFPPEPSMRLIADMIAFTVDEVPKWNPINICSYHLQEAGATPAQEIAYSLATAQAVLDEVRPRVPEESFPRVFGRISFFVNAGIRFVEEHAKLRAMGRLWEQIGRDRYGVEDPRYLRMRYGVQVNSLGLTESQPENNIIRIVLEALAVTLGRDARARAHPAAGLERGAGAAAAMGPAVVAADPADPGVRDRPPGLPRPVRGIEGHGRARGRAHRRRPEEMAVVEEQGGAVAAVPYMKTRLVESHRARVGRIERGEQQVIGQNVFTEHEPSPLQEGEDGGILTVDPAIEHAADRGGAGVALASATRLPWTLRSGTCARPPPTRARTSCPPRSPPPRPVPRRASGPARCARCSASTARRRAWATPPRRPTTTALTELRDRVERVSEALGRRIKILVGKPGLDGHSNGAEQIAVRARDAGMDVVYEGIRLTPARIAATAVQEGVHVVGLSILSGSHAELIPSVLGELADAGAEVPVVVGGIIPRADEEALLAAGVARVYTPKDFEVSKIMGDIVDLVAEHNGVAAGAA